MTQLELLDIAFVFFNSILFAMRSRIAPPVTRIFNNANCSQPAILQLTIETVQKTLGHIGAINVLATFVAIIVIRLNPVA